MVPIARCILAAALLITTFGLSAASAPRSGASDLSSGTGRYVVMFDGAQAPPDFAKRVGALGGEVPRLRETCGDIGFASVGGFTDAAARELRSAPGVRAVEPDLIVGAEDAAEPTAAEPPATEAADVSSEGDASPTEAEFYARQWNLREAIKAHKAWAAGYLGSETVRVFVLDTGIDYEHPDLKEDPDAVPPRKGRVDLKLSKSFVSSYSQEDELVASLPGNRHPITDLHSHGTAVAALIASNAELLAGVTQRTTLVGVKVHDRFRKGPLSNYLEGICYAANHEADVIHLSILLELNKRDYPALVAMVNYATSYAHRQGAVLVAAAGNKSADTPDPDLDTDADRFKFCNAMYVICVSATGPTKADSLNGPWYEQDTRAPDTYYGRTAIDVAGPGGNKDKGPWTKVWLACSQVTRVATPPQQPCREGKLIWSSTGTSFAAAATSGLAALLVSTMGQGIPDQIEAAIEQTADDLGDPVYFGKGRINVCQAVASLLPNGLPNDCE